MPTIYWNPQYTGPMPTADDTIEFTWGIGSFDTITAKNVVVNGGSIISIGTLNCTGTVNFNNGSQVTVGNVPTVIDTLIVTDGEIVDFTGGVVVKHLILGDGSIVSFNGGLTVQDTFEYGGGSQMHVSGHMDVCGTVVTDTGDVSSLWDSEMKSGTMIFHDQKKPKPCYLAGAFIDTAPGEVKPVEELKVGDTVMDYTDPQAPTQQKIVWVGKGTCTPDLDVPPDEGNVPVIIYAGAFGEHLPCDDLILTPEHMVVVNGVLVPVRVLAHMDWRTVRYHPFWLLMSNTPYTYYHFKTEKHAIVKANGILSESFFDEGHDEWGPGAENKEPVTGGMHTEPALPIRVDIPEIANFVTEMRHRLPEITGHVPAYTPLTPNPELRVPVTGSPVETILPIRFTGKGFVFVLPRKMRDSGVPYKVAFQCKELQRPSDVWPGQTDDRGLLSIRAKFIAYSDMGVQTDIPMSDIDGVLYDGWLGYNAFITVPENTAYLLIQLDNSFPFAGYGN